MREVDAKDGSEELKGEHGTELEKSFERCLRQATMVLVTCVGVRIPLLLS